MSFNKKPLFLLDALGIVQYAAERIKIIPGISLPF